MPGSLNPPIIYIRVGVCFQVPVCILKLLAKRLGSHQLCAAKLISQPSVEIVRLSGSAFTGTRLTVQDLVDQGETSINQAAVDGETVGRETASRGGRGNP